MKFPWKKESDDDMPDSAETLQIKDAANILKEGTQIPGKENIPVSDKAAVDEDTEDYDFLNQLFEQQRQTAEVRKKTAKKTTAADLLKGKQKKTAEDKQPLKNKTLYLCLILGIILAVLLASGVLFYTFTQATDDSTEIIDQIKLIFDPEKGMAKTENPETAPTPVPTPTPVPEKKDVLASYLTDAFSLKSVVAVDPSKTITIDTENTFSTKNMLGDTKLIFEAMQNMTNTKKLSVEVDSSAEALQNGEVEVGFLATENWLFDGSLLESAGISSSGNGNAASQFQDAAAYFSIFKKDESGNLIFVDSVETGKNSAENKTDDDGYAELSPKTDSGRIYEKGEYIFVISLDPSAPLLTKRTGITSLLSIPQGDYFDAGKQISGNAGGIYASEQNWETIHTEGVSPGKWVVQDFRITVNPANVPVYYQNKQYSTIVIQEPWRISWKVSKTGTDPYTGAELILVQYDADGNVIRTYGFGWKGKYSADTSQITPEFQPGEYALGLFLRGTGITLDFQQNKAMPVFDNFTVREK